MRKHDMQMCFNLCDVFAHRPVQREIKKIMKLSPEPSKVEFGGNIEDDQIIMQPTLILI